MGNTTSDVNDSLKAQADSEHGPELYKLVNVNDGGILASMMKTALLTKDFTEVDNFIQQEVVKYLYNGGQGEFLPIEKLVRKKAGDKITKDFFGETPKNIKTKEVCFNIDKIGAVGETLVHLCLLNGTPTFTELAKRLIKHFPKLVNDIYMSEDYFGEAALHMAIVSEDPVMVKFLLSNGANVHQRCNGKFFCPEDQKNNQTHIIYQEEPIVPVNTNYIGYAYFGEYPLSFAAILNQEECVRLLLRFGADPNKQDFNGNTVLHMLVINNNLTMFKMMLDYKASLNIKNKQGLTPLTLAAKLARKEMFQFILERLRHVWFTYADVSFGSYPLATIDTIGEDGTTDTTSALYLVINGETEAHLDLLEGLVVDLINTKWRSYVKYNYYFEVVFYFVYFALSTICVLLKRLYFDYLNSIHCTHSEAEETSMKSPECACAYLYPSDPNRYVRVTFEIIVALYSVLYLLILGSELYIQKLQLYIKTCRFNPSKVVFIFGLICYLLIIPFRLTCMYSVEDILSVLAIIFQSSYILYLGRGFKAITTFVFIIHKVMKTNFFRFIIIFFVFMCGFSQAFYVAFNFGKDPAEKVFNNWFESFYDLLILALHATDEVYEAMLQIRYVVVSQILLVIFLVIVSILLVNLLIAMMAHTYNVTTGLKREWLRQWSKQVLTIEQNVSVKERLKQQTKYACVLSNGEKAFLVRWKLTEREKRELKADRNLFRDIITENCENYDSYVQDV